MLEDRDEVSGTVPKRVFQLPENMPTAFVCNNDETAYYFIHYLESQGFRVPEDVSVTGFYDNKFATAGERGECRSPPDVGFGKPS